jgi:hypothetical protein
MLRKTLFVTTALVVASSMAFAKSNVPPRFQGTKVNPVRVQEAWKATTMAIRPAGYKHLLKATRGQPAVIPGKPIASNLNKDVNAAYLGSFGWYGAENVPGSSGTNSYSFYICLSNSCLHEGFVKIGNEHYKSNGVQGQAAVPFTNKKGSSPASITAAIGSYFGDPASGTIGIYTNNTNASKCGTGNGYSTVTPTSCPGTLVAGTSGTFTASHSWYFSETPCCGNLQTITLAGGGALKKKTQYWVVMGSGGAADNYVIWMGSNSNFTATMNGAQQDFNVADSGYYKYHYTATSASHKTGNLTDNYSFGSKGWVGDLESYDYYAQPAAFSVN